MEQIKKLTSLGIARGFCVGAIIGAETDLPRVVVPANPAGVDALAAASLYTLVPSDCESLLKCLGEAYAIGRHPVHRLAIHPNADAATKICPRRQARVRPKVPGTSGRTVDTKKSRKDRGGALEEEGDFDVAICVGEQSRIDIGVLRRQWTRVVEEALVEKHDPVVGVIDVVHHYVRLTAHVNGYGRATGVVAAELKARVAARSGAAGVVEWVGDLHGAAAAGERPFPAAPEQLVVIGERQDRENGREEDDKIGRKRPRLLMTTHMDRSRLRSM